MRVFVFAALAAVSVSLWGQSATRLASDDTWFYKNASDPVHLPFMLAWGNGSSDLDSSFPPGDFFSYSYVKFDISGVYDPTKLYTVIRAGLTVKQYAKAGFDQATGDANPLLARALGDKWEEATFVFGGSNPAPGDVVGKGSNSNYNPDAAFLIDINLLGNQEAMDKLFNEAVQGSGRLNFALTTHMDPGGQGGTKYYQLYTKDTGPTNAPVLNITAQVVPEPMSIALLLCGTIGVMGRRRRGE